MKRAFPASLVLFTVLLLAGGLVPCAAQNLPAYELIILPKPETELGVFDRYWRPYLNLPDSMSRISGRTG